MRSWRSTVVAVALSMVVAACVSAVAVADHEHKKTVMYRLEEAEWFCSHRGERCGGESSARVEDRWNTRQAAYEGALAATLAFAVIVAARGVLLRRRSRPDVLPPRGGEAEGA